MAELTPVALNRKFEKPDFHAKVMQADGRSIGLFLDRHDAVDLAYKIIATHKMIQRRAAMQTDTQLSLFVPNP
jgi:hypothetical protein